MPTFVSVTQVLLDPDVDDNLYMKNHCHGSDVSFCSHIYGMSRKHMVRKGQAPNYKILMNSL